MNEVRVILLEDCGGDRARMLSHLHRLWNREEFRHSWMRGLPWGDPEEDIGYSIPPGMEETPFLLFLGDAGLAALEFENEEICIRAELPLGQISAICSTPSAVSWCEELRQEITRFTAPCSREEPVLRMYQPAVWLHLEDELAQLSARALALPAFREGLMAAWEENAGFTRCRCPLPAGSEGIFYGYNETERSFVLYDSFSDQLVCCGSGKAILETCVAEGKDDK